MDRYPGRIVIDQSVYPFAGAGTDENVLPEGAAGSASGAGTALEDIPEETPPEQEASSADETVPSSEEAVAGEIDTSVGSVLSEAEVELVGEDDLFWQSEITDRIFDRIYGKSYREDCTMPRSELRYLRLLHYDFNGNIRVGELVCNRSVSSDMLSIFHRLYKAKYPIEKIVLVDEYGADDDASSADNNTSCFNYRTVAGSGSMSLHALGVAIDINPLYNPYVTDGGEGCAPENGRAYMDRSLDFAHKIDEDDLCYRLFTDAGFTWGGSWSSEPDYMHFSRGASPET